MMFDLERDKGERVLRESIVLIEQRAPFARREFERGIRAGGDVTVLLAEDEFDPRDRARAISSRNGRTSGSVEASSARQSSQCS